MELIDTFSADTTEQTVIEGQLRKYITDYEDEITKIRNVCREMSTSSAWKDTSIKDNFLHTLTNYIKSFDDLKKEMTTQVDNLSIATAAIDNIEGRFS